jgi:hypothetical protein
MADFVVVALLQVKINLFNNELALLVLLAGFKGPKIRPAHHVLAALAENVADCMQPSH